MNPTINIFFINLIIISISVIHGRSPNHIIGGQVAFEGEFPYQVSICKSNYEYFCGGTIIDSKHILTAAHCISNTDFSNVDDSIIYITTGTNFNMNIGISNIYEVSHVFIHRDFKINSLSDIDENDIAILLLKKIIEFNSAVQPINLPDENILTGKSAVLSGWGSLDNNQKPTIFLKKVYLTIINNELCASYNKKLFVKDQILCTVHDGGHGAGYGDSGGSLVVDNKIVGILSQGDPSIVSSQKTDIFTRVFSYLDWIKKVKNYEKINKHYTSKKIITMI